MPPKKPEGSPVSMLIAVKIKFAPRVAVTKTLQKLGPKFNRPKAKPLKVLMANLVF